MCEIYIAIINLFYFHGSRDLHSGTLISPLLSLSPFLENLLANYVTTITARPRFTKKRERERIKINASVPARERCASSMRRVNDFSPSPPPSPSPSHPMTETSFRRVRGPRRQVRYRNGAFVCKTFYSYSCSERAVSGLCAFFGTRVTARRAILARSEKRGDTAGRRRTHM